MVVQKTNMDGVKFLLSLYKASMRDFANITNGLIRK